MRSYARPRGAISLVVVLVGLVLEHLERPLVLVLVHEHATGSVEHGAGIVDLGALERRVDAALAQDRADLSREIRGLTSATYSPERSSS